MTTDAEKVVNAFLAAIENRDAEAAVALLAPDCEYDNVPIGKMHGPEAVAAVLERVFNESSEVDWPVHRQVASDTMVFNERTDRFLHSNGWIEVPVAGVWEVSDGKITLWRDYFDEAGYRAQLVQQPSSD